jgi:hypothetical protein
MTAGGGVPPAVGGNATKLKSGTGDRQGGGGSSAGANVKVWNLTSSYTL